MNAMTPNGPMYVVGRESSTHRQDTDEQKPNLRSIIDQLAVAVADAEAGAQQTREANAETEQLRLALNDLEARLAAERATTGSLREQLAETERLRLSAETALADAVQTQRTMADDHELRYRGVCEERDAARATVAQRDDLIEQLRSQLSSDRERHTAAIAQFRQELQRLNAEANRSSSIVHSIERVLGRHSDYEVNDSGVVAETSPRTEQGTLADARLAEAIRRAPTPSQVEPSDASAPESAAVAHPIDPYARDLLGTAEQIYELDREAGRSPVEILERLVSHLRYARDVVVRRAGGTPDGEAAFRGALSALFNERWEHEFGRTLAIATYELYSNSNHSEML
jgi:hypothetical protein